MSNWYSIKRLSEGNVDVTVHLKGSNWWTRMVSDLIRQYIRVKRGKPPIPPDVEGWYDDDEWPKDEVRVLAYYETRLSRVYISKGKWYLDESNKPIEVKFWQWADLEPKEKVQSRKAQLDKKVIFYRDASGKIMTGMPENIPAPKGYEKVVCNNVFEAERFSEMQRRQEQVEHSRSQAERGAIEAEFQGKIRSEMTTKMLNARNATNREFMRRALENNANRKDPTAYERESYLHAEGYEQGH